MAWAGDSQGPFLIFIGRERLGCSLVFRVSGLEDAGVPSSNPIRKQPQDLEPPAGQEQVSRRPGVLLRVLDQP